MNEENPNRIERSIVMRFVCGVLWFIPIYLAIQMTVGGIVGGMAGADVQTPEAGYAVGREASIAFFQKYGLLFFFLEAALTAGLSVTGILPGTGKWKKA